MVSILFPGVLTQDSCPLENPSLGSRLRREFLKCRKFWLTIRTNCNWRRDCPAKWYAHKMQITTIDYPPDQSQNSPKCAGEKTSDTLWAHHPVPATEPNDRLKRIQIYAFWCRAISFRKFNEKFCAFQCGRQCSQIGWVIGRVRTFRIDRSGVKFASSESPWSSGNGSS